MQRPRRFRPPRLAPLLAVIAMVSAASAQEKPSAAPPAARLSSAEMTWLRIAPAGEMWQAADTFQSFGAQCLGKKVTFAHPGMVNPDGIVETPLIASRVALLVPLDGISPSQRPNSPARPNSPMTDVEFARYVRDPRHWCVFREVKPEDMRRWVAAPIPPRPKYYVPLEVEWVTYIADLNPADDAPDSANAGNATVYLRFTDESAEKALRKQPVRQLTARTPEYLRYMEGLQKLVPADAVPLKPGQTKISQRLQRLDHLMVGLIIRQETAEGVPVPGTEKILWNVDSSGTIPPPAPRRLATNFGLGVQFPTAEAAQITFLGQPANDTNLVDAFRLSVEAGPRGAKYLGLSALLSTEKRDAATRIELRYAGESAIVPGWRGLPVTSRLIRGYRYAAYTGKIALSANQIFTNQLLNAEFGLRAIPFYALDPTKMADFDVAKENGLPVRLSLFGQYFLRRDSRLPNLAPRRFLGGLTGTASGKLATLPYIGVPVYASSQGWYFLSNGGFHVGSVTGKLELSAVITTVDQRQFTIKYLVGAQPESGYLWQPWNLAFAVTGF